MLHPFRFRPNPDELHCVPCSVGMLIEGMTGDSLTNEELEKICGFVPGKEVWEFGWLLHVADLGFSVRVVEDFDPEAFIEDPRAELMRQIADADVVERIFEVSDVPSQIPLVQACRAHPRVEFRQEVPTMSNLSDALDRDSAALVNLNARVLTEKDGYAGHVVLLHRGASGELIVEDPGPPPHDGTILSEELFVRAWTSPSEEMANYISVSATR